MEIMVKNRGQENQIRQVKKAIEFLRQFTMAEQTQLMGWLEELVEEGQIQIDPSHPLGSAFDGLTRYVSRKTDHLPVRVVQ